MSKSRPGWLILAVIGAALIAPAHGQAGSPTQVSAARLEMVPMPDGARLAADVYLPVGEGPWPALLVRTPYGREGLASFGRGLASFGIAAVMQDMRGRGGSEGTDAAFFTDKTDGRATLDWVLAQPWNNGRVGTFGASALGIAQYLMAPGAPDGLRCQWAEVATPDLYADMVYRGGAYRYELAERWLEAQGSAYLIPTWRANPLNTAFWDPVQIVDDYAAIRVPAVHVGGWYDIFARGTVNAFLGYQNRGGVGAIGAQHLIMGPWTHAVNNPQAGELLFPDGQLPGYDDWIGVWLAACLLDDPDSLASVAQLASVTYYTMGAVGEDGAPGNGWRTAQMWPPPAVEVPLYLLSGGALGTAMPGADGGADSFTYDPALPAPTLGGGNLTLVAGAYDQRPVEARPDVLVYTTAPLTEPVEVTGDLRAEIWISTDVPDTDIVVRLTDVYPDGRSMLVTDGILRARYAGSPDFTLPALLQPGVAYRLVVDLGPTSIVFNAGHRIRVSITASNVPRFLPNPNTGAFFLAEGETGQVAQITILRDAAHPSAVVLPVVQAGQ